MWVIITPLVGVRREDGERRITVEISGARGRAHDMSSGNQPDEPGRERMTWPPALSFEGALRRACDLDQAAISLLYKRFLPVVYRYAIARVGDLYAAEDVTSETFFAMVEGIATTRATDELTFAAWLLGIARNKVALHFRALRTHPETRRELAEDAHPFTTAEEADPLAVITARESWSEVVAALNLLTEEQRTVVLYRCILGYPTDDVARLMDKQPGTIRALQFRALASLDRHLNAARPPRTGGSDRPIKSHIAPQGRNGNASRR
jgi:RNA polymerase sigma-70 factor (ECF subfamily)